MTFELVLSRVSLPTDITDMIDTLVCGFLSQMYDIDMILKGALAATFIDAVFMRTGKRVNLRFPAPSLMELEIFTSDVLSTLLADYSSVRILLLFPFPSFLFQFFIRKSESNDFGVYAGFRYFRKVVLHHW